MLVTLLFLFAGIAVAQEPGQYAGHWEGMIQVPGNPLTIRVDLLVIDEAWSGTIDIPTQAAMGLALEGIAATGDTIRFAIRGVPGNPTFEGVLKEGRIAGSFRQSGQTIPFYLGREEIPPPPRPQLPQPPFPYEAEEITYTSGEVTLAGTLTRPTSGGPFPAVLLVTGSGAQDRDETIFDHKPFLVIADFLTRAGIAVLRVDDRGVGASTGTMATVTTADLAEDALAGVRYLRASSDIDPDRIGLAGHSEGGTIAPMVAARTDEVAFIILLAGTGVPGDEVLYRQLAGMSRAALRVEDWIERQETIQRSIMEAVKTDAQPDTLRARIERLIRMQSPTLDDANIEQALAREMARMTSPWYRFFLTYDPRTALRQVTVPVLALNGTLDLQVLHDQNLPEIEAALREAGNPDVTIRSFEGLNHLFQHARTGHLAEYARIEETVAPIVLETIRDWILARFGG